MAVRPTAPKRGNIAATAAVLLLAGCFAVPVLAAPDHGLVCSDDHAATLDVGSDALLPASHEVSGSDKPESVATTIESVADDHLLKPRVEAAARKIFAEDDASQDAEVAESEGDEVKETRLRRVSDNELVPFRRQMFRKDI
ncbi:MAG: hypothetical protein EX272_12145 [Chromatiales bacterium]|nr:MAG: hypothetical protein EX272_12145 [Chromatiales bacterium]